MLLVLFYSCLLIIGIIVSQTAELASIRAPLTLLTTLCLSYIMVEVGLEFNVDKKKLKPFIFDFGVATTAAVFPWLLCAGYFLSVFHLDWKESALLGLSAAPTSAGVLFAMLSAAGLGTTWLFQKARVLAIADDLATIILIIPLQIVLVGMKPELFSVIFIIFFLLFAAYRWLNCLHRPIQKPWLVLYSVFLVALVTGIEKILHTHISILLPAFTLGCILYNPDHFEKKEIHAHPLEEPANQYVLLDRLIKGTFMFLVGCSLPKVELGSLTPLMIAFHVLMLTLLSNIGKCFPALCYRSEASLRSRIGLAIAMFPRGEVGGGVLLLAISYGFGGTAASLAVLSLALNLLLTGVFISFILKIVKNDKE